MKKKSRLGSTIRGALCLKLMAAVAISSVSAQSPGYPGAQSREHAGLQTSGQASAPSRIPAMNSSGYRRHMASAASYASQGAAPVRTVSATAAGAPGESSTQLRKLQVPGVHAQAIATTLGLRYQDLSEVTIAPDAANNQLIVMAPPRAQVAIASEVQKLLASAVQQTSAVNAGPLSVRLQNISWREFERDLKQAAGKNVPMTTRNNGNQVTFQMNVPSMQGTLVEVDRRQNQVTVRAPDPAIAGWQKMISALDSVPNRYDDITKLHRLENAEMAPVQRTMRMLRALKGEPQQIENDVYQNVVMQADQGAAPQNEVSEEAGGPLGDVQIEYVPELGQIIVKGATRDVQRVMELIKDIEDKAKLTQPDSKVVPIQHADANAVAELLTQLYDDVLSTRQGDVSITSLDSPNSLLLIGRAEAIASLEELIKKIDQPVEEASRLRVFRLQNASAVDAQESILTFFSNRPGIEDDLRNGLGPRVRISADYRTNSLIVSAAPRDMTEVTRLINELDVEKTPATSELRVFTLNNAVAEDLATTLQDAFGAGEVGASEDASTPSTSLMMLAVDANEKKMVESGILAGATITADTSSNAIVVRAPSASMPLIAELIRQLDKAPGIDSLVKVFTIENGDATQLTTSLETLFGADAATSGTSVGGANAAGLPSSTAANESSLVPLRFSTDIRTNSIVASGSSADLEVVESILLRLDSEGFAERITEVIWLKNNDAARIAEAITSYVGERSRSQTTIQQYQQGLGPYDLLDRDIVAIAEENFNSILLSVSPRLYEEVRLLIERLDRRRPMVLIKVILAEVALEDTFEIGTELGLQDSLAFSRDQAVSDIFGSRGTGASGFNFNSANVANVNDVSRENIIGSTVTTFGVGTVSPNAGYGGFVLNAASESVSLLFRTLQDAGRAQIISRPQLMTADNTDALINVGRQIARFRGSTVSGNGVTTPIIEDVTVGLILNVRPRIGSDGTILMDVDVTRSDRDAGSGTLVPDVNGTVLIEDIIDTTAQATLSVQSGQTVIMGGLIQKSRSNISRRLPLISNIPIVGNLFKYDFEEEIRRELLVVMTPMLVTDEQDLEYIKATESSKMSWCLADVVEAHGDVGLSGGYGLWGPAIGPTIYPDVQPTIDGEVVVGELPEGAVIDQQRGITSPAQESLMAPQPQPSVPVTPAVEAPIQHGAAYQGARSTEAVLNSAVDPSGQPAQLPPPNAAEMTPVSQSAFRLPAAVLRDDSNQTLPASWMKLPTQ